jgi:hypothetical protein
MPSSDSPVAVAERHVAEAEQRVARQRRLIEELVRDKHLVTAEQARKVLRLLEDSLRLARIHLELERAHYGRPGAAV